ncbi:MAG: 50S ribosomal protein L10 [Candidatus Nanopelagicales bacterium]|nr:50S ribosomal protein L10 [Candidatus Nanopelagicales bacterium]
MAKPNKASTVAEIAEQFRGSSAAVLTEYRGLSVAQMKNLRRALGAGVNYAVVKNTLTKIAARDAGVTGLDSLLEGPSAIAFVSGDPVDAARGIRDFAKENPALVIKGGIMDGAVLSAADITKLANLESREVLLAKLAGAMKAKQSQAAALFAAPLSKTARTLAALQGKLESEPGAAVAAPAVEETAPAAEEAAPAADEAAVTTDEVVAEEVVTEEVATDEVIADEVVVTEEETTEG